MRLERYMIVKDLPNGVGFLCFSSHRTPEKAFEMLRKRRKQQKHLPPDSEHKGGLYVRDKYTRKRVRTVQVP